MSLTSLLNHPEIKELFSSIPSFKTSAKPFVPDKGLFLKRDEIISPLTTKPVLSSIIGTAFDFYMRAFLQRINKKEIEKNVSEIVLTGFYAACHNNLIKGVEKTKYKNLIHEIWNFRSSFINGEDVPFEKLAKAMIFLAKFDTYFRANGKGALFPEDYFQRIPKEAIDDLVILMKNTEEISPFFQMNEHLLCNPHFGNNSERVGGADGDFFLDYTLWDIKTVVDMSYKNEHIYQLLGYYLLSLNNLSWKKPIHHLGIYYSRYNQGMILSIEDIKKEINVFSLRNEFFLLVDKIRKKR